MSDISRTLELINPIVAHGETLTELKFRELTTEDVITCGQPFPIPTTDTDEIDVNFQTTKKYIVRLAGIPESSVKAMSPGDFIKASYMVAGFFGYATEGVAKT